MRRMRSRLDRLWRAVDELGFEVATTDQAVAKQAMAFMSDPGLAPRDAFHAAHARDTRCEVVVGSDSDYDRVPAVRRLGPSLVWLPETLLGHSQLLRERRPGRPSAQAGGLKSRSTRQWRQPEERRHHLIAQKAWDGSLAHREPRD